MKHFYKRIHGWSRFVNWYAEAVSNAPAEAQSTFVEVGAWKGKSAAYMAVEILNSKKDINFFVVDTWKGSDEEAHHEDPDVQAGRLYDVFMENMMPVIDYIAPMRMESVKAAGQFPDESIDFILLDASHDYENVKNDIDAWWPKLKDGGVMAGDDYLWDGVLAAVTEFIEANPDLKLELNERGVCWKIQKA